jgi:hypothetical protein
LHGCDSLPSCFLITVPFSPCSHNFLRGYGLLIDDRIELVTARPAVDKA